MTDANLSKEELLVEIAKLRDEVNELSTEIGDLEVLLEMTTEHSDTVGAELQDRAEEAIQESERRFRLITEATPVPVIIARIVDEVVVFGNPLAGPLLGFPATFAFLGRTLMEFMPHPEQYPLLMDMLVDQGQVDNYELELQRLDNSIIWVAISLRILDFNNEPSVLASLHNITQQKEAIENLKKVDRLKDEFLANTSHELRTPLNGIIGLSEALIDGVTGPLPDPTLYNLNMIVSSGRRLASLVNDILDSAKLRHQELQLKLVSVDICALTDVVVALSQPLIAKADVILWNEIQRDVPLVLADENRVQQILHNLIGNAIKFTHAGEICISAQQKEEYLAITVTDTGVGILADKLDHIFISFEQGDGSTAREYGGTGLGLSVSKQLVELHGGSIWVESEVGVGAAFTFTLPLSTEDRLSATFIKRQRSRSREIATIQSPPLLSQPASLLNVDPVGEKPRYHILIVDDEPINLQVLANYLLLENYAITQATSGSEALAYLESNPNGFDLAILDVMMPKMSGYELCRHIREKTPEHELPIILLTAKNQVEDLVLGFQNGANDYLTKPFSKDELLIRIRTHLRLRDLTLAYGRFVPREFLRFLGRNSIIDVQLGDQVQKDLTILFSDIRSFTTLSEQMTPQENFNFINTYLRRVSPIIRKHHGFIDKYIGDAIMALFPGDANNALQATIDMHHEVAAFNKHRQNKGYQPINIGVGLHTGRVMLGTVGETERMEGTVISDAVNLTARLEGLTKLYGAAIVVSDKTLFGLDRPNQYNFRFLDSVKVKGKREPVSVFEILDGYTQDVIERKLETRTNFEMALLHYHSREFVESHSFFEQVLQVDPTDEAAKLYLKRVKHFMDYGVPLDWEGTESLTEK